MVLNCAAFLLSLAWGLLIFTLSWLRWQSGANGTQVTQSPFLPCLAAVVAGCQTCPVFSFLGCICVSLVHCAVWYA